MAGEEEEEDGEKMRADVQKSQRGAGDEDGDGVHLMDVSGFQPLPRKTPYEEWG